MNKFVKIGVPVFLGAGLLFMLSTFRVYESQQAVVKQLGKIMGGPITKAGLYFKIPLLQKVHYFDKRLLNWDGNPAQVPTKDKKYIYVDTTARWKITDPVKFLRTVRDYDRAMRRITSIINGHTKTIVSSYNLVETVRNTNKIIDQVEMIRNSGSDDEEKVIGEIEKVQVGRERLSELILESSRKEIRSLGIELVDVLISRIAYEPKVEKKVFERMISERKRIAERIRSVGKGEVAKIQGKLNFDLNEIQSVAYRKSEIIKGEAEGTATKLYADTLKRSPKFYELLRTLEAYKKTLPGRANLIFSTENNFFKPLKDGP